ncbi:MAG: hypothetical protein QW292_04650 [Candidatus Parvarchaeota archaeon]
MSDPVYDLTFSSLWNLDLLDVTLQQTSLFSGKKPQTIKRLAGYKCGGKFAMERTISVGNASLVLHALQLPLHVIIPNPDQPRQSQTLDSDLRRSIAETKGLTTPLLVEKVDSSQLANKLEKLKNRYQDDSVLDYLAKCKPQYMIIDGERRWVNSVKLVSDDPENFKYLQNVPVDLIDGNLSEPQRYLLWVSIHKLRKDWKAMEQEGAARQLVKYFNDDAKAASILGITPSRLKKLIEIYDLAQEFRESKGPKAISYARELMNLSSKLRTPEVMDKVKEKIKANIITDPVSIRKLRRILVEPEARQKFLQDNSSIQDAMAYVSPNQFDGSSSLLRNLVAFRKILNSYGWSDLQALKKDPEALTEIEQSLSILNDIKRVISG